MNCGWKWTAENSGKTLLMDTNRLAIAAALGLLWLFILLLSILF